MTGNTAKQIWEILVNEARLWEVRVRPVPMATGEDIESRIG